MSSNLTDFKLLIDKFRKSHYFKHVVSRRIAEITVPRVMKNRLLKLDEQSFRKEFDELFEQYFMLGRMRRRALSNILNYNKISDIKKALDDLFLKDKTVKEKLESITELKNISWFFGTSLLAVAYNGEYIIYHDNVYEGIVNSNCINKNHMKPVKSSESYLAFNDICKAIQESYKFTCLAEVHEFFWHGKITDWTFE